MSKLKLDKSTLIFKQFWPGNKRLFTQKRKKKKKL